MVVCGRCHQENRADARFCDACGALLTEATAREERKVVSVLFADLVGSTSTAEGMDPEDVRALQDPYWQHVRSELERYGGTVEKFIGDAVVALFGAPAAHEDDPERAVRAALAIRDWAREHEGIDVRIGITTGEALVRLGAQPLAGEGMVSGDVVNTAARLQTAAPANAILVDEPTRRVTATTIEYAAAQPVSAKGKAAPVEVWEALEARSRLGVDVVQHARTPLLGRERELDVLKDALVRVREERSPQLVTLVGVPGIGKSRLVYELMQTAEADEEIVIWRQGRSLPYGDGVSFWALAEIVKAQAGVHENDTAEQAQEKLTRAVRVLIDDASEANWVERHLRPLVGLGGEGEGSADEQSEASAALRRFFEALADSRPAVLVFEDLHWADDGLLDFVDSLAEWVSDVPLLVIATARPELLELRPAWGGGKANATTLSLAPLSQEATAQLVRGLVERKLLTVEAEEALVEHAAGNPLYAEQYVRVWEERGGAEQLHLPETVHGLIAARLDGLSRMEKSVLQDAAVLGKVFWRGAIVAIDGIDAATAGECLYALQRKQFVQRARRSSVESELEYAFHHVLVRDVAYSQIPRMARAGKHERAASWIESLGRPDDHAEMLAHHYFSALELAGATGRRNDELAAQATLWLIRAGERASRVNSFPSAAAYYDQALQLIPDDAPRRPAVLLAYARALFASGDAKRVDALQRARAAVLAADDIDSAAEADTLLANVAWFQGRGNIADEHLQRAMTLIANRPPTPTKARVLAAVARVRMLAGEYGEAIHFAEEALALPSGHDLHELRAHALITLGVARWRSGERRGVADVERGLDLALEKNALPAVQRGYNNLAVIAGTEGDSARRYELLGQAERVANRLGDRHSANYIAAQIASQRYFRGEWEKALQFIDGFISECDAGTQHVQESGMRVIRAQIRLARDDEQGAVADLERALDLTRTTGILEDTVDDLAHAVMIYLELGRIEEAKTLATELQSFGPAMKDAVFALAWAADRIGLSKIDLEPLLAALPSEHRWRQATEHLLTDFRNAADFLAGLGNSTFEAEARRRAGATLVEQGRYTEANEQLEDALSFYRSVGATRFVRETETLLAEIHSTVG